MVGVAPFFVLCAEDVSEVGLSLWVFDSILPKALGVRSPLRVVRSLIAMSGLASMSSMVAGVAYMPCLRIEGRTSSNTQRSNFSASGSLLRVMSR